MTLNDDVFDLELNENSLEQHINDVTSMELPLDWENVFENDIDANMIHVDSAADGLVLSLANLGRVDIEYISKISSIAIKGKIMPFFLKFLFIEPTPKTVSHNISVQASSKIQRVFVAKRRLKGSTKL